MALNFPANPVPNQIWTDPANNYTYQWKVDPESPTGHGKWTTRISRDTGSLDYDYLRLDASNGPITNNLSVEGYIEVNSGPQSFRTPPTRGETGLFLRTLGDGTTDWHSSSSNPGPQPPSDPSIGDFWFNSANSNLYTWYNPGTGPQWMHCG
jgi:hypothetical protein